MPITLNDGQTSVGSIIQSMSNITPDGYLFCDGSAISRTSFSSLFSVSPSTTSVITMTAPASPCVVTWNNHNLSTGNSIQFSTTGALPTFSTIQTVYFVRVINSNTFNLYNTLSNAMNTTGTTGIINTSGTQSGTHTALVYFWGNGDGTTTFNIPDTQGVYLRSAGISNFGGTASVPVLLGSKINDAVQGHYHSVSHNAASTDWYTGYTGGGSPLGANSSASITAVGLANDGSNSSGTNPIRVTNETRVKSIAVNYFIKY